MGKAAAPVNGQTSTSLGLNLRKVVIKQIVPERGVAICEDSTNYSTEIPYRVQNAKGRMPQVGEVWYVDRSLGPWTFAAYVAADDSAFTTAEDQFTFSKGLVIPDGQQLQIGVIPSSVLAAIATRRANATDSVIGFGVGADSVSRYVVYSDGKTEWGAGGSTARDTNLYRSAANVLATDDALTVGGNLTIGSDVVNTAWTSYTPTWGGSTGAPSLGNGTVLAAYKQVGKTVHFRQHWTFGSTTNFGSGAYSFSLPSSAIEDTAVSAVLIDASGSPNRYSATGWISGSNVFRILPGTVTGVGIAPNTPFTWASSDELIMGGTYERS
jgi:hypothetical protein